MAKKEKLRMVKKGEGGGVPTPVSKLDDTELASLSTGKYKVFTNVIKQRHKTMTPKKQETSLWLGRVSPKQYF